MKDRMQYYNIKRFMELYDGDPEFRELLQQDPSRAVQKWNLEVDPEALRVLWDDQAGRDTDPETIHPDVQLYIEALKQGDKGIGDIIAAETTNRAYAKWRERQVNRFASQSFEFNWLIEHRPFTIELSSGCSVGCDYCCFAAEPLSGVARFTDENQKRFHEILDAMVDFFGSGAAEFGFLYWATDPFDNRDYEKYARAFFERFGRTPGATTAAWHRNVRRTKQALEQHLRDNGSIRFSVNSLEQFHFCLENFTAQELAGVKLVLQHPESTGDITAAGRGRTARADALVGTGACISGYLINLVEQSIKLITPTTDLQTWPLGYAVYRQGHFKDAEQLREFLSICEDNVISSNFNDDDVLRFRPDLSSRVESEGGFTLSSEFTKVTYDRPMQKDILSQIDGQKSVGEIVGHLMESHPAAVLYHTIRQLYQHGLFEQLPESTELPMVEVADLPLTAAVSH